MSNVSQEKVLEALKKIIDRETGSDIVSAGVVSGVSVRGGKVGFLITLHPRDRERKAWLQGACEEAVRVIPGVESVTVVLTGEASPAHAAETAGDKHKKPAIWNITPVAHVKRILAVASGKGGVGKSTVAVQLAFALQRLGQRVGLLDADIYGPSLPRMLGLSGQPKLVDKQMEPHEKDGVKAMSVGFLLADEAAILRGPMVSKTLQQLLRATRWGSEQEPLDVLLVDMPPGTGDVHLSMAQQVPLDGAIIVTTPQEVALSDARRALMMFTKVGVRVLGVIENMSGFTDPAGKVHYLFGEDGGKRLAQEACVPLLGSIPLDTALRIAGDVGEPDTSSVESLRLFDALAAKFL